MRKGLSRYLFLLLDFSRGALLEGVYDVCEVGVFVWMQDVRMCGVVNTWIEYVSVCEVCV